MQTNSFHDPYSSDEKESEAKTKAQTEEQKEPTERPRRGQMSNANLVPVIPAAEKNQTQKQGNKKRNQKVPKKT